AKKHRLFLTPEELNPPGVLQRLHQELGQSPSRPWVEARDGLGWVLEDPKACEVHLSLLSPAREPKHPLEQHRLEGLELKVRYVGPQSLTPQEKRELLLDAERSEERRVGKECRERTGGGR